MPDLTTLFCHVYDFCLACDKHLLPAKRIPAKTGPKPKLHLSEILTIFIYFHLSQYRHFKAFYTKYVQVHLTKEFPTLVSYPRFLALLPRTSLYLFAFLKSLQGSCTGITFVDSMPLKVCENLRIPRHRVFAGLAKRGKTSMGWFYGFKLHLAINEHGELLGVELTPGNVDDRKALPTVLSGVFGKVFGDKGYVGQKAFETWYAQGIELITRVRKNMKGGLRLWLDTVFLRKRSLIETVNDQRQNISQVSHTRHRSVLNFVLNVLAGLVAYSLQEKKPSLHRPQVNTTRAQAGLACLTNP